MIRFPLLDRMTALRVEVGKRLTSGAGNQYADSMTLDRAQESLQAAELCAREGFINSAASRAYYAMFQAAQVALQAAGFTGEEWSHAGLQATFTSELIHRRKLYRAIFRDYLTVGLRLRNAADYGDAGVSAKVTRRLLHRATAFLSVVEKETRHGSRP